MTRLVLGTSAVLAEEFDPNTVTPGVIGFIITFLIAAAVVLLVLDMTRRVRRVRYRGEIGERLDAEQAEQQATQREAADEVIRPRPISDDPESRQP